MSTEEPLQKLWSKADSLIDKGLDRSALDVVLEIKEIALAGELDADIVKSVLYQNRLLAGLEEEAPEKAIGRLEAEHQKAPPAAAAVLRSMLAEMYQNYLNYKRYQMQEQGANSGPAPDDIRLWSVAHFTDTIADHYLASMAYPGIREKPVGELETLFTADSLADTQRPFLFDILAHRALDYFMNDVAYLTTPVYAYVLADPEAFQPAAEFVKMSFTGRETVAQILKALQLFQQVLDFHLDDDDRAALLDADLKRLKFVHDRIVYTGKKDAYLEALDLLAVKFSGLPESAEIAYRRAELYNELGSGYAAGVDTAHQWAKSRAHQIAKKAILEYPDAYGSQFCKRLINQIERPDYTIGIEEVSLPNEEILAMVSYQNVGQVWYKIVRISNKEMDLLNALAREARVRYINKMEPVSTGSFRLRLLGDFQTHRTEIGIDNPGPGRYLLVTSSSGEFRNDRVALNAFHISNLGYFEMTQKEENGHFYVVDRKTGEPQENVIAYFYLKQYEPRSRKYRTYQTGSAKSDANGHFTGRAGASDNAGRDAFQIELIYGTDTLMLDDFYSVYTYRPRQRRIQMTRFFTDRSVYRPGQTVYFKGYLIENDEEGLPRAASNQEVIISFFDVNRQEKSRLALRSNAYGTVQGAFQVPSGGLAGQMHLHSDFGNSRSYFSVEEYKRPKFEVTFDPVTEQVKLGDAVTLKGKAMNYAGSPVDGAEVRFRVERSRFTPWWRYGSGRFWPGSQENTIMTYGTTETTGDGGFSIDFEVLPEPERTGEKDLYYSFRVFADVVDLTGETRTGEFSFRVGQKSYFVDITLGEKTDAVNLAEIPLHAQNLAGEDASVQGTLEVTELAGPGRPFRERYWQLPDLPGFSEAEYVQMFPGYQPPGREKIENWDPLRVYPLKTISMTGRDTLDMSGLLLAPGAYRFAFRFENPDGEVTELERYTIIYRMEAGGIPGFISHVEKLSGIEFEPGQSLQYRVGTGLEEGQDVLHFAERKGRESMQSWLSANPLTDQTLRVMENDRGGLLIGYAFVRDNRFYTRQERIRVPWSNKRLEISYGTFRDKLTPGDEEEWILKISGPDQEKIAAEMLVSMYDASLDAFRPHNWSMSLYPGNQFNTAVRQAGFGESRMQLIVNAASPPAVRIRQRVYRRLNWFGYLPGYRIFENSLDYMVAEEAPAMESRFDDPSAPPPAPARAAEGDARIIDREGAMKKGAGLDRPVDDQKGVSQPVKVRTDLEETAFFFPQLMTNENGDVLVKFKVKESLTRWKFQGIAHTLDMKYGLTRNEAVSRKDLMVFPNAPRFFRQGDKVYFTAKVNNTSDQEINGKISLQILDFFDRSVLNTSFGMQNGSSGFVLASGSSQSFDWEVNVPDNRVQPVLYRVVAEAGDFSDGEEAMVPVVSNRMLVTETLPISVKSNESRSFAFTSLDRNIKSKSLTSNKYTLEFTSNPAWYAIQALPYLMEFPHECSEQVFSRFYANALASHTAHRYPVVKAVFDRWRNAGSDALLSNLSKNEALKSALLEETPWVLDALSEEDQKRNIALLFDLNRMADEQQRSLSTLEQMQLSNGGFPWFQGGRDNWYITQYIAEGIGHLMKLGVLESGVNPAVQTIINRAVNYLDARIVETYRDLESRVREGKANFEDDHLSGIISHYLYTRSFYPDMPKSSALDAAITYYEEQASTYWLDKPLYTQGLLALGLRRAGIEQTPADILKSLEERSILDEELGRYWKAGSGYAWYQLPIERHALMVELFAEMTDNQGFVDELRVWLLRNKQTNRWPTTKSTSAAIYALLIHGDSWLEGSTMPSISIGGSPVSFNEADIEPGTGYVSKSWEGSRVDESFADIHVENKNDHMAWGAVYWQYFEDMDKISFFGDTPVKLQKELYVERPSDRGPVNVPLTGSESLSPGDKVIVRLIIESDREMEYLHLKDMRASGLEPVDVISRYTWAGGLGYYQSTKDLATHFFIDRLPRGKFIIEYDLRVFHHGDFSNGISILQSMYAPEFSAHTEGGRVFIEK